jgi:hypothetical protein
MIGGRSGYIQVQLRASQLEIPVADNVTGIKWLQHARLKLIIAPSVLVDIVARLPEPHFAHGRPQRVLLPTTKQRVDR